MKSDLPDIKSFADIRACTEHEERFVYNKGISGGAARYSFGCEPRTAAEFGALEYVGGQSLN